MSTYCAGSVDSMMNEPVGAQRLSGLVLFLDSTSAHLDV
jgi:hypothetical protein